MTPISSANLNKLTVRLIGPKFIQVSSLVSLTKCCKFVNMTAGFYAFLANLHNFRNRPFPSCLEPSNGSEDNCRVFVMKTSFHSYTNKANFRMKSFAPSLAFVMRFTAIRKWSI